MTSSERVPNFFSTLTRYVPVRHGDLGQVDRSEGWRAYHTVRAGSK